MKTISSNKNCIVWVIDNNPTQLFRLRHSYKMANFFMPNIDKFIYVTKKHPLLNKIVKDEEIIKFYSRFPHCLNKIDAYYDLAHRKNYNNILYLDTDVLCLKSFEPLLEENDYITLQLSPGIRIFENPIKELLNETFSYNSGVEIISADYAYNYKEFSEYLDRLMNLGYRVENYTDLNKYFNFDDEWASAACINLNNKQPTINKYLQILTQPYQLKDQLTGIRYASKKYLFNIPEILFDKCYSFHYNDRQTKYYYDSQLNEITEYIRKRNNG